MSILLGSEVMHSQPREDTSEKVFWFVIGEVREEFKRALKMHTHNEA